MAWLLSVFPLQLLIKTPDISYGTPSTRESILLPQPIFPVQTGYSLGLGYDSTSGDYKILNICSHSHGSKVPGEILSLKSGSWRTIDNHPRGIENLLHCSGSALALVNDAFHWVCISGNYFEDSRAFSLVSFSISKEVYADIPLPEQLLRLEGNIGIGVSELDGMLCAHSICEHLRSAHLSYGY
ncbi:F-box protein CPR1-like [Capsicum annuum]|uniref:F-box protein CPR1-like n=1 Tax=Capsicum annuum TaxID=4072 RepID=UPI001FB09DF3|nr:F-box protein CPR1-like [Capsicum annuum]